MDSAMHLERKTLNQQNSNYHSILPCMFYTHTLNRQRHNDDKSHNTQLRETGTLQHQHYHHLNWIPLITSTACLHCTVSTTAEHWSAEAVQRICIQLCIRQQCRIDKCHSPISVLNTTCTSQCTDLHYTGHGRRSSSQPNHTAASSACKR